MGKDWDQGVEKLGVVEGRVQNRRSLERFPGTLEDVGERSYDSGSVVEKS